MFEINFNKINKKRRQIRTLKKKKEKRREIRECLDDTEINNLLKKQEESEMGELYALDFDGVICDSCGESSLSALKVPPSLSLSLNVKTIFGFFIFSLECCKFSIFYYFAIHGV